MAPYGIEKDLGGDSPSNTKWMEDCVSKVMRRTDKNGNRIPKDRAIAICKSSFQKSHGKASEAERNVEFLLDLYFSMKTLK